jgi:hypothetical protein
MWGLLHLQRKIDRMSRSRQTTSETPVLAGEGRP